MDLKSEDNGNLFRVLGSHPDQLVLRVMQDLKMENARACVTGLEELRQPDQKTVVFDLSRVRYIDSPGIGVMLKVADIMQREKGRLLLYGLSGSLLSVFRLAGLLKIFEILSDTDAERDYPELLLS